MLRAAHWHTHRWCWYIYYYHYYYYSCDIYKQIITRTSQTLQLGSPFSDSGFSKPYQGRGVDSRYFWRPWRRFYSVSHSWAKATDSWRASRTLRDQKLPAAEQTNRLNTASCRTFWNCPPGRGRRLPDNLSSKPVHRAPSALMSSGRDWMSANDGNDAKEIVKPNQRWSRNEQRQDLMHARNQCMWPSLCATPAWTAKTGWHDLPSDKQHNIIHVSLP